MSATFNKTFVNQSDLGTYCRTGKNAPKTTKPQHVHHYRRLVYGVVKDTLKTAFPLTKKLVGKKRWKKMVDTFFVSHKCQNAQVWKMPVEFYQFYHENELPFKKKYSFLDELLHFEWLEIEVFMMEDEDIIPNKIEGNWDEEMIVSNPEIRILPVKYPLHLKDVEEITAEDEGQYFACIIRNQADKTLSFWDLPYAYVEMLVAINDEPTSKKELYMIMEKQIKNRDQQTEIIEKFIEMGLKSNLILGLRL